MTCTDCAATIIPLNRWQALDQTARRKHRERGIHSHGGRGLCKNCYHRRKARDELIDAERLSRTIEEVMQEFAHLDLNREISLNRRFQLAAPRLGMTYAALSRAYYRARQTGKWNAA